ncbi:MAG: hypothetical protein WC089_03225 [Candidatus Paceibacterota bacterium]
MERKSIKEHERVDIYTWALNTPLEIFLEYMKIQKPWRRILRDPENKEFMKCERVMDLLELESIVFLKSMGVGDVSYRQLMKALYDFGIKGCFWYPIGSIDSVRLLKHKDLILKYRMEISKQ